MKPGTQRSFQPKPIAELAERLGVDADRLEPFGHFKVKIRLDGAEQPSRGGKLVLVTAMTPTPSGEGKTTVSIGLVDGLARLGKQAVGVLREPSLGPVFGIKGGATGGGASLLFPHEDINLHFTGDLAAVERAHNLLAALIDNWLHHQSREPLLDSRTVSWRRVMDMNDRSLREIVCGLGGSTHGVPRSTGFDITAASEVMAILCLAPDLAGLKRGLGNILVGFSLQGDPIYARDLKADGAMSVLLRDAIKPNLVQTIENNPVLVHGGPFANIAQGTNSLVATRLGVTCGDYVVTEAGFGSDLGAEKFFNIKSRLGGLQPSAVIVVATIKALKYHGGARLKELDQPSIDRVQAGLPNLEHHVRLVRSFGVEPVVAVNRFDSDTEVEIESLLRSLQSLSIPAASCSPFQEGGAGCQELASKLIEVSSNATPRIRYTYDLSDSIEEKIEKVAQKIYGAASVVFQPQARRDIQRAYDLGLNEVPVCIAKTHRSLSDNPLLRCVPSGFEFHIREVSPAAGAGFLVPIAGDMMRMPGLPTKPSAEAIDLTPDGQIVGLR